MPGTKFSPAFLLMQNLEKPLSVSRRYDVGMTSVRPFAADTICS